MDTPHDPLVQKTLRILLVIGLMTCANIAPVAAQGIPPLLEPPPGSTITTDPVTFSGAHTSADLKHLLRIGSSLGGSNLFSQSLGTGHSATVSGLPSSGPIYVSYWTLNSAGWFVNRVVYTMDVGSGPRVWNCPAGDVDCLINAITIGNGSGNPEIIQLAAGTYTLDSLDNGSNLLPSIIGNITIEGAETTSTIIRSSLASNIIAESLTTFNVDESATLELKSLSIIKGGTAIRNSGSATVHEGTISDNLIHTNFRAGTGIVNNQTGTMTIEDSTVSNYNQVFPGGGGAIQNAGTMDLTGSSIEGNSSSGGTGGITNGGMLTITTSTIARNVGHDGGDGAIVNGGSLELINSLVQNNFGFVGGLVSFGQTNISKSIFTGNRSETGVSGGAIFNAGPMTISQSVIALNKAGEGAGIFNRGADLSLEQTVILGNEAASDGGGIKNVNNGRLTLTETVITNNTPDDCVGCP